jgi:hypothetical protein
MPYCPACGNQVGDEHNFCPKCGKPAGNSTFATTPSAAAVQRAESENSFLVEGNVRVTNARFISGGQTYAMSGITSVKRTVQKPKYGVWVFLALIGFVFLLAGKEAAIFGVLLIVVAIAVAASLKSDHFVVLHSSSGEMNALSSKDESFIQRVVEAINEAIVFRR